MTRRRFRRLAVGLTASASAALLALTSIAHSAFAFGDSVTVAGPGLDIGLVMGGSGTPIPGPEYVDAANSLYIEPNFPGVTFPGALASGLFTPEGLYPLEGIHNLPLNYPLDVDGFPASSTSVGQGVTILNNAIQANLAAGDTTTVFGYSQSAIIASLEMRQLDPAGTPSADPINFVLIGDPSAPNGGLFERFDGLNIPSLGISFDGATPANDFPTVIYSLEYDGYTDFPQYPINFLADLNAFLGIEAIHGKYLDLTPAEVASAVQLPTSGATETTYYMIPETPPLVSALADVPVVGKPLAALLGPDLTILINLGYGNPDYGYSAGPDGPLPANVPTTFGLFPDVNPATVMADLQAGAQQGFTDFQSAVSNLSLAMPSAGGAAADSSVPMAAPTLSGIADALSSAASSAYSTLLPTADIVNALVTAVPAYDASLFTDNLQNGDLMDALGLPVAANTALYTLAAGFEYVVISNAASAIAADFGGLSP